jgi:hypothetical protein
MITQIEADEQATVFQIEGQGFEKMRLPVPHPADPEERSTRAQGQTSLFGIMPLLGGLTKDDAHLGAILNHDTVFERQMLQDTYRSWMQTLSRDLVEPVGRARKVLQDTDLKDAVRDARAREALQPGLESMSSALEVGMKPILDRAAALTIAVEAALLPAPATGEAAIIRELRADQVRRRAMDMKPSEVPKFAIQLAERGMVDALHALEDDPCGVRFLDATVTTRAREMLLDTLGGLALAVAWKDALHLAEVAASRAEIVAGRVLAMLPLQEPPRFRFLAAVQEQVAGFVSRARLPVWQGAGQMRKAA